MDESVFQDCLGEKDLAQSGHKKGFWIKLAKRHGYRSAELVRNAFKYECRKRNIKFDRGETRREERTSFEQSDDFINIVCASPRMLTKEEVMRQFNVDENQWEVERFKVKTSEGYRKDRKVDWHVVDGRVTHGDVEDSGMMLVVPLYHIEVRLKRKTEQIRARGHCPISGAVCFNGEHTDSGRNKKPGRE